MVVSQGKHLRKAMFVIKNPDVTRVT